MAGTFADASVVVATADPDLLDGILSITAAVGVDPLLAGDAGALRPVWTAAGVVLIGADEAARVAALGLPRRPGVFLVGTELDGNELLAWSMPLGAAVMTLPASAGRLSTVIGELARPQPGDGRLICVVGGSGGAGASTCASALALAAARSCGPTMLVDADPGGGGVDLMLGAESLPGWRWPRLAGARGHLGDLSGQLPHSDGVDVLAMSRDEAGAGWRLAAEPLGAVLRSATRTHRLTVVDLPRSLSNASREAISQAHLVLLVVAGHVRGAAAARAMLSGLADLSADVAIIVRQVRPRLHDAESLAATLGLDLLGSIEHDLGLVSAAERGEPPASASLGEVCRAILSHAALDAAGRRETSPSRDVWSPTTARGRPVVARWN